MLRRPEVVRALHGVARLLHWQRDSFSWFSPTFDGFVHSFWVIAGTLPVFVASAWIQRDVIHPKSAVHYYALAFLANIIGWLLYPLVVLRLCRLLDCGGRYYTYMVAYNWFQLVQLAWLPILLLTRFGDLPADAVAFFELLTYGVFFAYSWFIARYGLEIGSGSAAALVVIDFLLGILIESVVERLV